MNNYVKPYFTDETGRLFRDETGNTDNGESIPLEIEIGRSNFGTDQKKGFGSIIADSENARGAIIQYGLDGGAFNTLDEIHKNVQKLTFPQNNQLIEARDINFKIVHNDKGDPPIFNGLTTYYYLTEYGVNENL